MRSTPKSPCLRRIEQNPPAVGLDRHREAVLSERVGRGGTVVPQNGVLAPLQLYSGPFLVQSDDRALPGPAA